MRFYSPSAVTTVSTLNVVGWDADLIVPAAYKIKTDHIAETTGAHGIVTDQALKPAAGVTGNLTQNANLVIPAAYKVTVDHIAETTGAHGIVTDSLLAPAVGATLAAGQVLKADHIAETTGAHGIVTDSLLAPAVGATLAAGQVLKSDHITETTGAHGVTSDVNLIAPTPAIQDNDTSVATTAFLHQNIDRKCVASATERKSDAGAEYTTTSASYVTKATLYIPWYYRIGSIVRCTFNLKTSNAAFYASAKVGAGEVSTLNTNYEAKSIDVTITSENQALIFEIKADGTHITSAQHFKLCSTDALQGIPAWNSAW